MEELEASELGTLQYWENRYKKEIDNFSNHGDMGEIWFGEDIADKVILWMFKNIEKSCSIVDIGCGNGHILIELANEGYVDLTGLDYSEKAVNLAKAIAANKHFQIRYYVCDILKGLEHTYDIIHDKGTYDAISLSENSKEGRGMYIGSVKQALKPNGNFIITSCNWTHSELQEQYKDFFKLHYIIPTPQFMFGGKIGSVVSICVFKHVNN